MADTRIEEPVRRYLSYARDPGRLVDHEARTRLENELETTEDPLERLELRQRIADLDPEGQREQIERDFVAHVRTFAKESGISAAALRAEGASEALLVRAGLLSTTPARGQTSAAATGRSGRLGRAQLRQRIVQSSEPFTVTQMIELTGGSPATVRAVVQALHEEGELDDLGADSSYRGPGPAPRRYQRRTGRT